MKGSLFKTFGIPGESKMAALTLQVASDKVRPTECRNNELSREHRTPDPSDSDEAFTIA